MFEGLDAKGQVHFVECLLERSSISEGSRKIILDDLRTFLKLTLYLGDAVKQSRVLPDTRTLVEGMMKLTDVFTSQSVHARKYADEILHDLAVRVLSGLRATLEVQIYIRQGIDTLTLHPDTLG